MRTIFQFVTDVEGDLDFFKKQIRRSQVVRFTDTTESALTFISDNPSELFIFGGDVCDRGFDITITQMLVTLKQQHPDRVILIVGNRDANKTRFCTELPLNPNEILNADPRSVINPTFSSKSYADFLLARTDTPIERLKWILACTMGAPAAFESRRRELMAIHNQPNISDEAVYSSFRESVEPTGFMAQYLLHAQIGAIIGDTLIVHGGITDTNCGIAPNGFIAFEQPSQTAGGLFQASTPSTVRIENARDWIQTLNDWYARAIHRWTSSELQSN